MPIRKRQKEKRLEIGDWLEVVLQDADFGDDLPLSDQLKFKQATGSFLRDHFRGGSL